jgi:hypothetical protein
MGFSAGQCWIYRSPHGFEASRLIIGAILRFEGADSIICCSVTDAPRRQASGGFETVTIPFLPMTESALSATVVALAGSREPPADFAVKLQEWSSDPRGLSTFTVPFDGHLDHLIAHQMAQIVGLDAA